MSLVPHLSAIFLTVAIMSAETDAPTLVKDVTLPVFYQGKKSGEIVVKAGAKVTVIERNNLQAHVTYGPADGWISTSHFLATATSTPEPSAVAIPKQTIQLDRLEAAAIIASAAGASQSFTFNGLEWALEYSETPTSSTRPPDEITFTARPPREPSLSSPPPVDSSRPVSTEIKLRNWLSKANDTDEKYERAMADYRSKSYTLTLTQEGWEKFTNYLLLARDWREKSIAQSLPHGVEKPLGEVGKIKLVFQTPSTVLMDGKKIEIDDLLRVAQSVKVMNATYLTNAQITVAEVKKWKVEENKDPSDEKDAKKQKTDLVEKALSN